MSEFPNALDLVYSTLRDLRDQGVELRASTDALERLASTRTAASAVSKTAAVEPPVAVAAPVAATPKLVPELEPVKATTRVSEAAPVSHFDGQRVAPTEGSRTERLAAMRGPVLACTKCPHLVESRTQVVFGVGNPEAELMFVGEAPGEDEDK